MLQRLLIAALMLVAAAAPAAAAAAPMDKLAGRWTGPVTQRAGPMLASAETLEFVLRETGDGFHASLRAGTKDLISGNFVPSEHEGVFEVPRGGGLMSLFQGPRPANPLAGEPLVWARRDGSGLVLYRLALDGGAFHLDRADCQPKDGAVDVTFAVRAHAQAPMRLEAQLTRRGN